MRYQEPIYIQNENSAVRNKDIYNVNMSSDMYVFEAPVFTMSGASKIDCSGNSESHVISTATTIPLVFDFTGNTDTFSATSNSFYFEVYKYNRNASIFTTPPVYKSELVSYTAITGSSSYTENVPVSALTLDGEYLIKGYYKVGAQTFFMSQLGKTYDTINFRYGSEYGLYNSDLDFYFISMYEASKPIFADTSESLSQGQLGQQVVLPEDGDTVFVIKYPYGGHVMVTLNGLILAKDEDYTITGSVVTFLAPTYKGDVVTFVYSVSANRGLVGDNILISSPIVSGTTDNEGTNSVYYNTDSEKFEVYTELEPSASGAILVMVNGVTLANNIDYYKSKTNDKRIILEGNLIVGDMITLVYYPVTNLSRGINTNFPSVLWTISRSPQTDNGYFTLQVSRNSSFSPLTYSSAQQYVSGVSEYTDNFVASGTVGTTYYYRIKNDKVFDPICGPSLTSTTYSDTISIVVQSNAINSY